MRSLLLIQIVGAAFAAIVFRLGLEPRVAGLLAGGVFVVVGVYGILTSLRNRHVHRIAILVGVLAAIHLFGVALPMLGFRVLSWNEPFSNVAVWGLSGPEFHKISTRFYGAWMAVTATAWWLQRKKDPRGSSFT